VTSLIEQAALRLEQLRQAGISVPQIEPEKLSALGQTPPEPPIAELHSAASESAKKEAVVTDPTEASKRPTPIDKRRPEAAASNSEGGGIAQSKRVELNLAALHEAGFVTPHAERSRMADQYRVIKRPLISNAMGKGASTLNHGNLIMVTSALPGEGKTFTSVNLAMRWMRMWRGPHCWGHLDCLPALVCLIYCKGELKCPMYCSEPMLIN
jgi:protein-tyrosine kinase